MWPPAAEGTIAFSGVGSVSYNHIENTIETFIDGGSSISTHSGGVKLATTDDSLIIANAGAVSLAFAVGVGTSTAGTVGASVAVNEIGNEIRSYIDGSTVVTAGDVDLTAVSNATIWAMTLAGVGGVAVGGGDTADINGAASVSYQCGQQYHGELYYRQW